MADNQNNQFQVTTSLISMFDENSNQLRLAGLESGLSVAIWVPEITPEGKMTFPQEKRTSVILGADAVSALNWIIKNRIIPAWDSGKDFKIGVPTNRSATNIIDIIGVNGDIYLRMHKELDGDRKPKTSLIFKFVQTPTTTNYNPQTGEFDTELVPAQFVMFCDTIAAYTYVGSVAGHSGRVAQRFTINSFYQYLQAIASKLGAVVQTGGYNRGGAQGNSYGSTAGQSAYTGQMNEVSSMDALLS